MYILANFRSLAHELKRPNSKKIKSTENKSLWVVYIYVTILWKKTPAWPYQQMGLITQSQVFSIGFGYSAIKNSHASEIQPQRESIELKSFEKNQSPLVGRCTIDMRGIRKVFKRNINPGVDEAGPSSPENTDQLIQQRGSTDEYESISFWYLNHRKKPPK